MKKFELVLAARVYHDFQKPNQVMTEVVKRQANFHCRACKFYTERVKFIMNDRNNEQSQIRISVAMIYGTSQWSILISWG